MSTIMELFYELNASPETIAEEIPLDLPIAPATAGQLLMTMLPPEAGPLSFDQISFWAAVADHMGPDFVRALSTVVAFMESHL